MENDDNKLIERFLENELRPEELIVFNRKLDTSQEFRKLLQEEQKLRKGIEYSVLKNMEAELKALEEESFLPSKIHNRNEIRLWNTTIFRVAASLIILISVVLVVILFNQKEHFDSNLAFKTYFKPYPNDYYNIKRNMTELSTNVDKGFFYYNAGDYNKALTYFENIPTSERNALISFYMANAYLSVNKIPPAKELLLSIPDDAKNLIKDQTDWYLALCYLKTNDLSSAQKILMEIKDSKGSPFKNEATELLEEINF